MTLRHCLIAFATFAAGATSAAAQPAGWRFWTGEDLLRNCQSSFTGRTGCTSYIAGLVDGHETYAAAGYGRRLFCPPAAAKVGQFRDRVVTFLETRPQSRGQTASGLVIAAMQSAYPCPTTGRPRRRR